MTFKSLICTIFCLCLLFNSQLLYTQIKDKKQSVEEGTEEEKSSNSEPGSSQDANSAKNKSEPLEHHAEINIRGRNYKLKLRKIDSQEYPYEFSITKSSDETKSDERKSYSFNLQSIALESGDTEKVFKSKLFETYFKVLNPVSPTEKEDNELLSNLTNYGPKYSLAAAVKLNETLKRLETEWNYDKKARREKLMALGKGLEEAVERDSFRVKINTHFAINQRKQDSLKWELFSKSSAFLSEARKKEFAERKRGNRVSQSLFLGSRLGVNQQLKKLYNSSSQFLHRQSVKIGKQIYTIAAKEVAWKGNVYYVFHFRYGKDTVMFEMETVEANANSIEVMSESLRQGLDQFLDYRQRTNNTQSSGQQRSFEVKAEKESEFQIRSQQLHYSDIQFISTTADLLNSNLNDFTFQDFNKIRNIIKKAADQYGFDARELRTTLKATGIIEAIQNSRFNNLRNTQAPASNIIDEWISEATLTYLKYFEDLELELRTIASNFLFLAYKNTIKITEDSLAIGYLVAKDIVPIYHRTRTFKNMEINPSKGKKENDYLPIGEFKVRKIKIEFEDEMIRNIEVRGDQLSNKGGISSTSKIPKFIYVKFYNRIHKIPTNKDALYTLSKSPIREAWEDSVYTSFGEAEIRKGELELKIVNLNSTFTEDAFSSGKVKFNKKEVKLKETEAKIKTLKSLQEDKSKILKSISDFEIEIKKDTTKKEEFSKKIEEANNKLSKLTEKLEKFIKNEGKGFENGEKSLDQQITDIERKLKLEENKIRSSLELEEEVKTFALSFDFYVVLKLEMPGEDDYYEEDKALRFDVKTYLDPNGIEAFRSFNSVKPYVILDVSDIDADELDAKNKNELKLNSTEARALWWSDFDVYARDKLGAQVKYELEGSEKPDNIKSGSLILPKPELYRFELETRNKSIEDYIASETELVFQNKFPISYSTKRDVTSPYASGKKRRIRQLFELNNENFIELDELITNDIVYYNRTENYSPRSDVIIIDEFNKRKPIYKEFARELLKAKIFSDFVGLDESNPNGLVQTEISKKLFLNTTATPMFQNSVYSGFVNYIEPKLVISKIEEQNKFLELNTAFFPGSEDSVANYVSSIDILNYSNLQVGFSTGLAYFSVPRLHTRLELGLGGFINQSGFSNTLTTYDSLSNTFIREEKEFNGNSLIYYPELRLQFNPDPRFGFQIAYRPTFVSLLSREVSQVDNLDLFLENGRALNNTSATHMLQLFAFVEVNKSGNGEFFFRSNFTMANDDRTVNFLQAQLGYAFSIFGAKDSGSENTKIKK